MEVTVKHVVELSPETLGVLKGLVSAATASVEVQDKEVKTCICDQKDETAPAEAAPAKKTRKPRAKKETAPAEPEQAQEEAPAAEPVVYTHEQVSRIAFAAFEKLSKDPEAPIGPEALTKKVRVLVLGEEKGNDPENHENAAIASLTDEQRAAFVQYCESDEVGCADVVKSVMEDA